MMPALAPLRFAPLLACLALAAPPGRAAPARYYVDAALGEDANDGTSPSAAWRSLERVNATTFGPGDEILLKSGSAWTGNLAPRGSGAPGRPIVIGRYGGGRLPRIDGGGITGTATVWLHNQEYWEVGDLEITNDAPAPGDRRGVLVSAEDAGVLHHIHLRNLDIHNIRGIAGGDNGEKDPKRTAGIGIEAAGEGGAVSRFDDLLIEGCTIHAIDETGLYTDANARQAYPGTAAWMARRFTGVRIRGNTIHHIAKNAMIVRFLDQGVVERNVCYETALKTTGNTIFSASCDGTVFQYNEGYLNRSPGADGSLYDADLRSPNTVWQYSYSHDNAHGLFWTCTVQADANITCRYNVSRNDRGIIFCIAYPNTSVSCYNNTVVCGEGTSPVIISERNTGGPGPRTYSFRNNVIINRSPAARYLLRGGNYRRTVEANLFFGIHPADEPGDPRKITADPLLADPGAGGLGLRSVDGFRLLPGSPCIGSGIPVPGSGGLDYTGAPLNAGAGTDRGAFAHRP